MLRAKLLIILSILILGGGLQLAQAYPPSGYDVITTSAQIEVYPDTIGGPTETIPMVGYAVIWRGDPFDDDGVMTINTRMDTLLMRGWSAVSGDSVFVTLDRSIVSTGQITQLTPGIDFPAESFFDVYYIITHGSQPDPLKSSATGG